MSYWLRDLLFDDVGDLGLLHMSYLCSPSSLSTQLIVSHRSKSDQEQILFQHPCEICEAWICNKTLVLISVPNDGLFIYTEHVIQFLPENQI